MKPFQVELESPTLPGELPTPYPPKERPWLEMLATGDAVIWKDLPVWKDFQSFSRDLFTNKFILTVATVKGKEIDHALNWMTPEQKTKLAWIYGKRTESGIFEKGGEITIGDTCLRVRPMGKAARKGLKKISIHTPGNKKNGYLIDFAFIADSAEDILPALEFCKKLDLYVPDSGTVASMSRNLLMIDCPRAFRTAQGKPIFDALADALGPKVISLYKAASGVFRLGRFEAFVYGTVPFAYVYDLRAAYPSKIGKLHHPAPPYCEWEEFDGDESKLLRGDCVYAFLYVEETLPNNFVGLGSHRTYTLGGTRLSYPWGYGKRWIGLEQYKLRRVRGLRPDILHGWLGFSKIPFYPMEELADKMWEGRQIAPRLYKKLDVRMVGNFMAAYWAIVDDGSEYGQLVKKPLPTYCPIYAGAVVDSVLADMTSTALSVPPDKLYGLHIDNIQTGVELATSEEPGGLQLKYKGRIREFTDHVGDIRGNDRWADAYREGYLEVVRSPSPSLVTCFGRPGNDMDRKQREFDEGFKNPSIVKVPTGLGKRFEEEQVDPMKEYTPGRTPNTIELPELYMGSWFEEDYLDVIDEEV